MKRIQALFLLFFALLATSLFNSAYAHDSRPLFVEIIELGDNRLSLSWKIPPSVLSNTPPIVMMPPDCRALTQASGPPQMKRQLYECAGALSGAEIRVHWPKFNPSISTMFSLKKLSGEDHRQILGPDRLIWKIPHQESLTTISKDYLLMGIQHILYGFDHLLFVLCLIIIASSMRRILLTITGFTLAHSITLILAALGIIQVPVPAVEAVIALSIVCLATEIARNNRTTLTWQHPILVASAFGLLHGFGFAAVLNDIGLPQTEVPAALLFFNLGVEAGQILFIFSCFGLFFLFKKLTITTQNHSQISSPAPFVYLPKSMRYIAAYSIGIIATYWFFERIQSFIV